MVLGLLRWENEVLANTRRFGPGKEALSNGNTATDHQNCPNHCFAKRSKRLPQAGCRVLLPDNPNAVFHPHSAGNLKFSFLLLLLPLQSLAQGGGTYTGPTMQQTQQSVQDFNRTTNQRFQDFQQRHNQQQHLPVASPSRTPEERLLDRATLLQSEQEANEQLARLAQAQQRQRRDHPAADPQQAAAQQRADEKQLAVLAATNYREVLLRVQALQAREAQVLSLPSRVRLSNMGEALLDDAWWAHQAGPQLTENLQAYRDTLAALTTGLLGFALASPPPVPPRLSLGALEAGLANDAFDPNAATQLVRNAALTEQLRASDQLLQAVQHFTALATAGPAQPGDPQKRRKEIQKSMRAVEGEMKRYHLGIYGSDEVESAVQALRKSLAAYVANNSN